MTLDPERVRAIGERVNLSRSVIGGNVFCHRCGWEWDDHDPNCLTGQLAYLLSLLPQPGAAREGVPCLTCGEELRPFWRCCPVCGQWCKVESPISAPASEPVEGEGLRAADALRGTPEGERTVSDLQSEARGMNKKHCIGCRDNFYNGNNPYGVTECWMLKSAELVTRFRLSIDTPMNLRDRYHKETRPNCYHEKGYIFVKQIPDYAK